AFAPASFFVAARRARDGADGRDTARHRAPAGERHRSVLAHPRELLLFCLDLDRHQLRGGGRAQHQLAAAARGRAFSFFFFFRFFAVAAFRRRGSRRFRFALRFFLCRFPRCFFVGGFFFGRLFLFARSLFRRARRVLSERDVHFGDAKRAGCESDAAEFDGARFLQALRVLPALDRRGRRRGEALVAGDRAVAEPLQ